MCTESVEGGGIKFWDPVEDSDTGGLSSISVRIEYQFAFQFWYSELCVENRWGGGRRHCFVTFLFFDGALTIDESGVVEWSGKSYLGPAEYSSFSSTDFSRSKKYDTFWHVVLTGYFYVLFLWAIVVSYFLFYYHFYSQQSRK